MKKLFFINFFALFSINLLILFEVKDLFNIRWNMTNILVSTFALFFSILILIVVQNIIYSSTLRYFTSYDLDYEDNRNKVLTTIFLVSELLLLLLYIVFSINPHLLFSLQKLKLLSPLFFSILFTLLLNLKKKDFIVFNISIATMNLLLLLFEKMATFIYRTL